jgi:leucyl-tRNA synthetase
MVPEEELPVLLPKNVQLTGEGGSPLARHQAFVETTCPTCGGAARRETDTMDTFVESSWYFARYCSADYNEKPGLDKKRVDYWLPVDQYIGGIEHAILHLLYARFYAKMLRDLGIISVDEPFTNLLTQGMVCKETTRCPEHGYLYPEEVVDGKCTRCGAQVAIGKTEKMSKSLKNVVDPDKLISQYGADTARIFCLFAAPPEKDLEWNEQGVDGAFRFLNRTWRIVMEYLEDIQALKAFDGKELLDGDLKNFRRKIHQTIRKVSSDIEDRFHFNTAISAIMELVNALYLLERPGKDDRVGLSVVREAMEAIILMLAPIVPHVAQELWTMLGEKSALFFATWPIWDDAVASAEEMTIVVQVNGKVRSKMIVPVDEAAEKIQALALADEKVAKFIEGKPIIKQVYVPGRLVNIVIKG